MRLRALARSRARPSRGRGSPRRCPCARRAGRSLPPCPRPPASTGGRARGAGGGRRRAGSDGAPRRRSSPSESRTLAPRSWPSTRHRARAGLRRRRGVYREARGPRVPRRPRRTRRGRDGRGSSCEQSYCWRVIAIPALPPPAIEQPAARQISYGVVTGTAAKGTRRVLVYANGKRLASKPLDGRRFTLHVALPFGDATVRVVTIASGGRRSSAHVHDVYGVPGSSRPRVVPARLDSVLQRKLTPVVRSYRGTAAYYVQSLTGGWGAAWNAKARFPAASTVK